ncbi:septum formation initiator family protein [Salinisphaera sp. T31B1]|uniref:septum formation initiator family protein n=1 Tax=Salinisphaera sp. T31B1 TaxID=727963 RepID=UPI00333E40E7
MGLPVDLSRAVGRFTGGLSVPTGQSAWSRYNPGMYRAVIIVLVVALAGLQYRLWIADGGWSEIHRLTHMKHDLAAANDRHRLRNDALQAEVDDLKGGESATEGRARSDMGMIKRDEEFFLTVAPPATASAHQQAAR